jgi:hypothetical protein
MLIILNRDPNTGLFRDWNICNKQNIPIRKVKWILNITLFYLNRHIYTCNAEVEIMKQFSNLDLKFKENMKWMKKAIFANPDLFSEQLLKILSLTIYAHRYHLTACPLSGRQSMQSTPYASPITKGWRSSDCLILRHWHRSSDCDGRSFHAF